MLDIKNLHVAVGGKEILKGLTLSIQPGQVHAIMGPNGSGKSMIEGAWICSDPSDWRCRTRSS